MMKRRRPRISGQASLDQHPLSYNCFRIAMVLLVIIVLMCITYLAHGAIDKVIAAATPEDCKDYLIWIGTAIVMPILGVFIGPYVSEFVRR